MRAARWDALPLPARKDALRSYFAEPYLSAIAREDAITVSWALGHESFIDRDYDKVDASHIRAQIGT